MASDDWRITIEVEGAEGVVGRLGDLGEEAQELAADLKKRRLSVSRDDETIFVYASSRADAERAQACHGFRVPGCGPCRHVASRMLLTSSNP